LTPAHIGGVISRQFNSSELALLSELVTEAAYVITSSKAVKYAPRLTTANHAELEPLVLKVQRLARRGYV
jgi:hypothetical protein